MSLYDVIRRPVVTEKTTALAEQGKYVFEVAVDAGKTRVKEAIQVAFGVGVSHVNIMRVRGKVKRFGRRPKAMRSWKKAVVTLHAGDKIDLFEST
ncbi:MAG: 50S ribosomal protein L23 [Dehalococcoidia bacterium]